MSGPKIPRRPPARKLPRMEGVVHDFNALMHDLVVRSSSFRNHVYIPVPAHVNPGDCRDNRVIFLDRRPGSDGFSHQDDVIEKSRIFTRIDRGRAPVIYIMVGPAPSKPVPDAQKAEQNAAYRRDHGHGYP